MTPILLHWNLLFTHFKYCTWGEQS